MEYFRARTLANGQAGAHIVPYLGDNHNQLNVDAPQARLPDAGAVATPVSVPIGIRRRAVPNLPPTTFTAGGSNQTATQIPVNFNLDLNNYSEQERATIRNFLQAVGITDRATELATTQNAFLRPPEGSATGSGSASGLTLGEIDHGATNDIPLDPYEGFVGLQRMGRVRDLRERQRDGERQLPERIQALEVVDRRSIQTVGDQMDDEDAGDDDEEMILG